MTSTPVHARGFASDNYSGIHPEVLAAIAAANVDHEPAYGADSVTERLHGTPRGRPLSEPVDSAHLWVGELPDTLRPGAHVLEVESTDMFGRIHTGHRIFRVLGGPDP